MNPDKHPHGVFKNANGRKDFLNLTEIQDLETLHLSYKCCCSISKRRRNFVESFAKTFMMEAGPHVKGVFVTVSLSNDDPEWTNLV